MLTTVNAVLLKDLSLGMAFEVFIVISLIILFIVSLCSLLQKIRRHYDQDNDRRRITVSEVYVQDSPPEYVEVQGDAPQGVYPAGTAPPPAYTEYFVDPPPKYDDVIKPNQGTPATHQNTANTTQSPPFISVVASSH